MVKINGVDNIPGGFVTIPGATYVGDSKILGLTIFLDGAYSSKVLLKFIGQKPVKIEYQEFVRTIGFLEAFKTGAARHYDSSRPKSSKISVVLLESSRVHLHWENASIVLFPLEFMQALDVLVAIRRKMTTMVERRAELKALLANGGFLEFLKTWGILLIFLLLVVFDFLFFISLFTWPQYYGYWIGLTVFLSVWFLYCRPSWADRFMPAIRDYFDEGFLGDLSAATFPRKSFGLGILLIILLILYAYFGSRVVNFLLSVFNGGFSR